MPARPLAIGIVVFWLTSMGWMFYEETWPRFGANTPPPLYFDMSDEVQRHIRWLIFHKGKMVGHLDTRTKRLLDRTYRMRADYTFLRMMKPAKTIGIRNVFTTLWVTPSGKLKRVWAELKLHFLVEDRSTNLLDVEFSGEVRNKKLHPQYRVLGGLIWKDSTLFKLNPVAIPSGGRIVNTMQPLHRIVGLREGRRWTIPEFNPISAAISNITLKSVVASMKVSELVAIVYKDTLKWHGDKVDCWRIDYAAPGKDAVAHTWVRKRDGLVLQQQANYEGMELTIVRAREH